MNTSIESNVGRASNLSVAKRLFQIIKEYKFIYLQIILISLLFTISGFALSVYVKNITDAVLPNGDTVQLHKLSVFVLTIIACQYFMSYFKDIYLLRIGQVIDGKLILGYLSNVLNETQTYYTNNRAGEVISKINDSVKSRNFLTTVLLSLITNSLIVLFSLALILLYNWKLGIAIFFILPIYFCVFIVSRKLNKKTERRIMEESSSFREEVISSLNNIKTIKVLGLEDYTFKKIEGRFIPFIKTSFISAKNSLGIQYSHNLISNLFIVILLWLGSYFVMQGKISSGVLFSCYFIFNYSLSSIQYLVNVDSQVQNAFISAERLFKEISDQEDKARKLLPFNNSNIGNITFHNIAVRFGDRNIFNKFNLEIKRNEITAIIGESGVGKSTLANLVSKYIRPNEGHVYLGGSDISVFDNSYKNFVSLISQETELFNTSFVENIHLGANHDVDIPRIQAIFKDLGLTSIIDELPDGIYTNVGENGGRLSGGQRQRLAIARALYKNASILIFDESTSALDNKNIGMINQLMVRLKRAGKTIVIITHKMDTLAIADRVIMLGNNEVIADGIHNELIHTNPNYNKFYNISVEL